MPSFWAKRKPPAKCHRNRSRSPILELSQIGFIGGGSMAFAIGSGLINGGIVKPGQVMASGPNLHNLERWRNIGASVTDDNAEVIEKSDIIFISVKPHILEPCCQSLKWTYSPTARDKEKLLVSVLVGVNPHTLEKSFSFIPSLKMIRTMLNTPMQVGDGVTVYTPAGSYVHQDLEKVHLMLNTLKTAQQVPKVMIDAVTGRFSISPFPCKQFIKLDLPKIFPFQILTKPPIIISKTFLYLKDNPQNPP